MCNSFFYSTGNHPATGAVRSAAEPLFTGHSTGGSVTLHGLESNLVHLRAPVHVARSHGTPATANHQGQTAGARPGLHGNHHKAKPTGSAEKKRGHHQGVHQIARMAKPPNPAAEGGEPHVRLPLYSSCCVASSTSAKSATKCTKLESTLRKPAEMRNHSRGAHLAGNPQPRRQWSAREPDGPCGPAPCQREGVLRPTWILA